jgi:hypothetical protein
MAEETNPNTAGEETPNTDKAAQSTPAGEPPKGKTAGEDAPPSTVEEQAPSVVSENLHSESEAIAAEIPTANAPNPSENLVANPDEAKEKGTAVVDNPEETDLQAKTAGKPGAKKAAPPKGDKPAAAAAGDKPAAKAAKKEKAPAVEDKPFAEFIQQDYLPAVKKALAAQGVSDVDLTFAKQKIPIAGYTQDECWQIVGRWQKNKVNRQFNIYFPEENIQGKRAFSCNEGSHPSTLEAFLIDERKVTLDLMIYGLVQRLNGQKWLAIN